MSLCKEEAKLAWIAPEIKEEYTNFKVIGRGQYGIVYSLKDKKTGEKLAMKMLKPRSICDSLSSIQELDILGRLRHPNLVSSRKIVFHRNPEMKINNIYIYIFMDLAVGDLNTYLSDVNPKASEGTKMKLFHDICSGVLFLHQNNIVHADLKTYNVLVFTDSKGKPTAKIADFGGVAYGDKKKTIKDYVSTTDYLPPEVKLDGKTPRKNLDKNDSWALGMIFFRIFSGRKFYSSEIMEKVKTKGKDEKETQIILLKKYFRDDPTLKSFLKDFDGVKKYFDESKVDFLRNSLNYDPKKRWSVSDFFNSSLFEEFELSRPAPGSTSIASDSDLSPLKNELYSFIFSTSVDILLTFHECPVETLFLVSDLIIRTMKIFDEQDKFTEEDFFLYSLSLITISRRITVCRNTDICKFAIRRFIQVNSIGELRSRAKKMGIRDTETISKDDLIDKVECEVDSECVPNFLHPMIMEIKDFEARVLEIIGEKIYVPNFFTVSNTADQVREAVMFIKEQQNYTYENVEKHKKNCEGTKLSSSKHLLLEEIRDLLD